MKTCSTPDAAPPPDRHTAWACTLANLLALPGLGSLAAGRKVGWVQAALAVAGFGLVMYGLVRTALDLLASAEPVLAFTPALTLALVGGVLSVVSWCWALVTSIQVHREARAQDRETSARETPATPPRL
jgi:hypothetical protein